MSDSPVSRIPLIKVKLKEKGRIKDIKNIIIRITGLQSCLNGQIVDFGTGVKGIVMGFNEEDVLVLALGDVGGLRMGQEVSGISEPFKIGVGDAYLGRMVDTMGLPCDGGPDITPTLMMPVLTESRTITERAPVNQFLQTGTKMIDAMVPIGRGQRQLLIGDRMTGKTTVAVDAILSQKDRDVVCIYCCIGKSVSTLEKVVGVLKQRGALEYSIILASTDNSPAGEQYLAPFAAATLGDFFMRHGRHVLVVFDDLTKHAWAYRQLSLLLERSPGREAYPGDIFYVQTQLMERAGKLNDENGGGSMTFLGVAETLQGDLTSYIPSNLISMCDGQVFFSTTRFSEGQRPAIDFGLSVSITGGKAQPPALREITRTLRADYQNYSELVKISRLQTTLSADAEKLLKRGETILAVLQQDQHRLASLAEQVILLYALEARRLDNLGRMEKDKFVGEIFALAEQQNKALVAELNEGRALTPKTRRELDELLDAYFAAAPQV